MSTPIESNYRLIPKGVADNAAFILRELAAGRTPQADYLALAESLEYEKHSSDDVVLG